MEDSTGPASMFDTRAATMSATMAGDQQHPHPPFVIPERFRIVDLETWLANNTLRSADDSPDARLLEEEERLRQETEYEQRVHERIFSNESDEDGTYPYGDPSSVNSRRRLLSYLREQAVTMDFETADGVLRNIPLATLAESCDTIYGWITTRITQSSRDLSLTEKRICLHDFHLAELKEFLAVVIDRKDIQEICISIDNCVVDVLRLAHYLQHFSLVQDLESALCDSIDTENCMSLCQLADQLRLTRLFETSLGHVTRKLGQAEDVDQHHDMLTPELRDRIKAIKYAIHSSVHSTSSLYFSSLEEFLAMFAERVQYNKERLAEAKESLSQIEPDTHTWKDTYQKIQRQEQRLQTLELVYKEQKCLFSSMLSR